MSYLEGEGVVHIVLPGCNLFHLLLNVLLCGSLYVYVVAVSTGIVAGDGLGTHTDARKHTE